MEKSPGVDILHCIMYPYPNPCGSLTPAWPRTAMYDPENNPGFPPDAPQNTDFRWRRLPVSHEQLNDMVRQNGRTPKYRTAPQDLVVLTVDTVTQGGWWIFLVWSETFSPVPNDGKHITEEIPLVEFWSSD